MRNCWKRGGGGKDLFSQITSQNAPGSDVDPDCDATRVQTFCKSSLRQQFGVLKWVIVTSTRIRLSSRVFATFHVPSCKGCATYRLGVKAHSEANSENAHLPQLRYIEASTTNHHRTTYHLLHSHPPKPPRTKTTHPGVPNSVTARSTNIAPRPSLFRSEK
jgi:hypothetical protein